MSMDKAARSVGLVSRTTRSSDTAPSNGRSPEIASAGSQFREERARGPWRPTPQPGRVIKIYIAEEQQILRQAYQSFFQPNPALEVVGTSGQTDSESLVTATTALDPDVLLLGIKILQPSVVQRLETIRQQCSGVAVVLLSASYDVKGIKALREFSRRATVGCAYLLKHTIDTVEQLTQVIQSVAQGRIILDPAVMEGFINSTDAKSSFLKDLSPRELEVLSWIAKGYNNHTIADVLCLEPKTIERHINGIYNKLGTAPDSKHARVHVATLYLRATGSLLADDSGEAS